MGVGERKCHGKKERKRKREELKQQHVQLNIKCICVKGDHGDQGEKKATKSTEQNRDKSKRKGEQSI